MEEVTMAAQSRLIKKYPNRRLYDTRTSTYITLADVKQLVLSHEAFQVVDAKSGEDLTRAILLQVILEEEAGGAPMFSSELLSHSLGDATTRPRADRRLRVAGLPQGGVRRRTDPDPAARRGLRDFRQL
jgi:polyhydroxyalkanoate synthesis repressor PhaR